jgi:hypothetical protein
LYACNYRLLVSLQKLLLGNALGRCCFTGWHDTTSIMSTLRPLNGCMRQFEQVVNTWVSLNLRHLGIKTPQGQPVKMVVLIIIIKLTS